MNKAGNLADARSYRGRPTPLAEKALTVLEHKDVAPAPHEVKHNQLLAVDARDDYALALWSRIRWQWVVASGRAEVELG